VLVYSLVRCLKLLRLVILNRLGFNRCLSLRITPIALSHRDGRETAVRKINCVFQVKLTEVHLKNKTTLIAFIAHCYGKAIVCLLFKALPRDSKVGVGQVLVMSNFKTEIFIKILVFQCTKWSKYYVTKSEKKIKM